jgi:hypothetical protein
VQDNPRGVDDSPDALEIIAEKYGSYHVHDLVEIRHGIARLQACTIRIQRFMNGVHHERTGIPRDHLPYARIFQN